MPHPVRPILQIEIHPDPRLLRRQHVPPNIRHMLLQRLPQLIRTMLLRPLGQQVHDPTAALGNPPQRNTSIHKSEHLDPIQIAALLPPLHDLTDRPPLTLAHPGRSNLDPVDPQLGQQQPRKTQLLLWRKRNTGSLFPVPEGRIHYLYSPHLHSSFSILFSNNRSLATSWDCRLLTSVSSRCFG